MFRSINDILGHRRTSRRTHYKNRVFEHQDCFDFLQLIRNWEKVVGEGLAKNTYPLKINYGALTVLTKHSIYSQELSFLAEDIKKKITTIYPTLRKQIKTLKFQTSPAFFKNIYKPLEEEVYNETKKTHDFNPQYRELKNQAINEFSDVEDEELKEILISLYVQRKNTVE